MQIRSCMLFSPMIISMILNSKGDSPNVPAINTIFVLHLSSFCFIPSLCEMHNSMRKYEQNTRSVTLWRTVLMLHTCSLLCPLPFSVNAVIYKGVITFNWVRLSVTIITMSKFLMTTCLFLVITNHRSLHKHVDPQRVKRISIKDIQSLTPKHMLTLLGSMLIHVVVLLLWLTLQTQLPPQINHH